MNNFVDDLKDWFRDFVKALIFFLLLQTYVAQGFVIEGACMEPELHSHEKILVNKMVYHLKEPEIGEVVVFTYPYQPDKDFIKRVVGVPGDEIAIKDGYLYRNGKKMNESFVKEYVFGNYGPLKIPEGKLCVMGDNRNNSHDSRAWGLLDRKLVKGRADIKFWPVKEIGMIPVRKD